jgi:hypothetical protein
MKFYHVDRLYPKSEYNRIGLDGFIKINPGEEYDFWTEPGEWELPEWVITTKGLSFELVRLNNEAVSIKNTSDSVIILKQV